MNTKASGNTVLIYFQSLLINKITGADKIFNFEYVLIVGELSVYNIRKSE